MVGSIDQVYFEIAEATFLVDYSRTQVYEHLSRNGTSSILCRAPLSILLLSMPKVGLEFLSALDMAVYRRNAWGFLALQPPASNDLLR